MNLPSELDVATTITDFEFNSYVYKVKNVQAVGGENVTNLNITSKIESPESPSTILSFENPTGAKHIRIVAQPKNQGGNVAAVRDLTADK